MLELKNISSGYGKREVLSDISVNFEAGKLISVIGPNGSGKSTLLKTVLGFIKPFSGDILLDRVSVLQEKRGKIAKKIAYLPQGKNLPCMTVEQLVLHGRFPHLSYPRRYSQKDYLIANEAIKQMGLCGFEKMPLASLSGGMRQKVYIAMCIAQDTDYILLDEPATYLDIAHSLELMKLLKELGESGKCVIAVMHDLTLALNFSDELLLLNEGKKVAACSAEQLVKTEYIKQIFGVGISYLPEQNGYFYDYSINLP